MKNRRKFKLEISKKVVAIPARFIHRSGVFRSVHLGADRSEYVLLFSGRIRFYILRIGFLKLLSSGEPEFRDFGSHPIATQFLVTEFLVV